MRSLVGSAFPWTALIGRLSGWGSDRCDRNTATGCIHALASCPIEFPQRPSIRRSWWRRLGAVPPPCGLLFPRTAHHSCIGSIQHANDTGAPRVCQQSWLLNDDTCPKSFEIVSRERRVNPS
ncbi:hypothetical protein M011DRAFT_249241 [Sporormia fimetaria CBS 119925]|uniref:Uncharacterized protein n=1 Tax=Sporormia fimetaria CBS 119925 TaxID=1340428 RepID=A0A6A6UZ44_9PLEO|nr:hypothetical protein M011DRAFT_249241 [Sporormia fimetaria CBS 119925]